MTAARPAHPRHRARAFTLLELLVVLVLMGAALALVAPTVARRIPPNAAGEALQRVRGRAMRLGQAVDTVIAGRHLHITATGACLPVGASPDTARWDPARCAPAAATR